MLGGINNLSITIQSVSNIITINKYYPSNKLGFGFIDRGNQYNPGPRIICQTNSTNISNVFGYYDPWYHVGKVDASYQETPNKNSIYAGLNYGKWYGDLSFIPLFLV